MYRSSVTRSPPSTELPECINPSLLLRAFPALYDNRIDLIEQLKDPREFQAACGANEADPAHRPDLGDVPHVPGPSRPCDREGGWGAVAVSPELPGVSSQPLVDSLRGSRPEGVVSGSLPGNKVLAPTGSAVVVNTAPKGKRSKKKALTLEGDKRRKKAKILRVRKRGVCLRCSVYKEEV